MSRWPTVSIETTPQGESSQRLAFLEAHEEELYGFLLHWVSGRRRAAEHLLSETLDQARRNAARIGDGVDVRSWLFTLARRHVIEYRRSRPADDDPADADDVSTPPATAAHHLAAHSLHPRAVDDLPLALRQVLIELYARGRTIGEAAIHLGIPETMVRSRAYQGLQALRTALRSTAQSQ